MAPQSLSGARSRSEDSQGGVQPAGDLPVAGPHHCAGRPPQDREGNHARYFFFSLFVPGDEHACYFISLNESDGCLLCVLDRNQHVF